MDRLGREAVAASGFEHPRCEPLVDRESAVQIRAIGDLDHQFLGGARAKPVKVLELPVAPERFDIAAEPMPGDDWVRCRVGKCIGRAKLIVA